MYLIDTNALIILLFGEVADGKLGEESTKIMKTVDKLYLSVVSLWEMSIKIKLGKLDIKRSISDIEDICNKNGIEIIPIKATHMDMSMSFPLLQDHKDPFDRLIMAVAKSEKMVLISTDERVRRAEYAVDVIW